MKYLLFFILSVFIFLGISYAILRIYCFVLSLKIESLNKKNSYMYYRIIKMTYAIIMDSRRKYYEANFYEDYIEKQKIQTECRKKYEENVRHLELYKQKTEFMQYLTETEKNEIKEILESPKYELY